MCIRDRNKINVFDKSDGTTTEPGEETLGALLDTHFKECQEIPFSSYSSRNTTNRGVISSKYEDWLSMEKIVAALDGFEKKKSPGPDNIRPLIFEHLPEKILLYIQIIYKSCIHLHYTPVLWKETKVIFIPKPGKESYRTPKSFRPISLSNYFLKGLERLVGWKMDEALVEHPIHPKQHGFTVNKCTESAISNTCLLYTSPSPRD